MRPNFLSTPNLSLKHRLPLLIGALLLSVILASTWVSYRGVKEAALEVGRERLENLTRQLVNLSQQSTANLLNKTSAAANEASITAFLRSPTPKTRSDAAAVLQQFTAPQDPNSLQVELWNANRELVLTLPDGVAREPAELDAEFIAGSVEPFKAVGPMRLINETIAVPGLAAVKDNTGKPIGYLVRWRHISSNPPPHQLTDLLGSGAQLYFGNLRGDLLTNLEGVVAQPQPGLGSAPAISYYSRNGNWVMAQGRPIVGTPWFVLVEFPEQPFLTQAHQFLRRAIFFDLILLAFGIAAAFSLSRGITQPLRLLTDAASAIGVGDYSRTVAIPRKDELGSLAAGFNAMTMKVRDYRGELERKIEDLRESEQRLQTVIENLNDGLVISNLEGQLLKWNKAALEMHGFDSLNECLLKLPEFANTFELSTLGGDVLPLSEWPLQRIISGERLHNLEIQIRRLDADWSRIFCYGGNIVREANGTSLAFLSIIDITERKRVEEEQHRLALLVESSEDAIIGKSLDGTVTSWNKAAERLYGYTAEEIMGRSIAILDPPEAAGNVAAILDRLSRGENIDHLEIERITKEGSRVFVSLTISPIRENSDVITGWSTIARDITAAKRGEEALRDSEIRYRRLFESAKDGILILDAGSGRILDVNPYLSDLLGMPKQDLLGQELWELGPFDDIVASRTAFAELQQRGYMRYENLPLEDREGTLRHVEFVSNSYLAGERRVIQCNVRDVTERKLAEEELRQSKESLEQALADLYTRTNELTSTTAQLWQAAKLATMGELAASVAHELNNPLATISLHAENLVAQLPANDPHLKSLEVIEQEVARMGTLVGNLLQFSRRSHKQLSTVDLSDELANSLDFIQYHLRSHKIEIVSELSAGLPTVQADRQQLRQVFLNLLTNASDAMPQGGTLTVRSFLGTMPGGQDAVIIEFSDTGIGVQPGDLTKLWEPFFTTKPEGKGTGLGLAICRRTIEEHRGKIEIETGPGKGVTVRIALPATDKDIEVARE
ncbi:MAG: hypothetical protein QOJ88_1264 [Pyrinomonadaceae bacterium]|jgi:PAS domain S-box-containing protein|nr:hypothetical protein [Pyrinomonadaceae bacterium]